MSISIYEAATISTSPREELDVWLPKNMLRQKKEKEKQNPPFFSSHLPDHHL
jgi:hypothetical protein